MRDGITLLLYYLTALSQSAFSKISMVRLTPKQKTMVCVGLPSFLPQSSVKVRSALQLSYMHKVPT